jgi:hypothetical protein
LLIQNSSMPGDFEDVDAEKHDEEYEYGYEEIEYGEDEEEDEDPSGMKAFDIASHLKIDSLR